MRTFSTGATRDTDAGKLDFEGFLSPLALVRFAEYMHENRLQADGKLRDSDNWQKGIPLEVYFKSKFRHMMSSWETWRLQIGNPEDFLDFAQKIERELCAELFNIQGALHEIVRKRREIESGFEVATISTEATARRPAKRQAPRKRRR